MTMEASAEPVLEQADGQVAAKPVRRRIRPRDVRWIRAAAELAGTFLICAVIYLSYSFGQLVMGQPSVVLPVLGTALTYLVVTAMLGGVSGGHFNPAVTVAAMFTSQISMVDGLIYIVAQVIGAIGAGALAVALVPVSKSVPDRTWLMFSVNGFSGGSPAAATLGQQHIAFGAPMAIVVELIGCMIVVAAAITTLRSDGRARRNHALYTGLAYGVGVLVTYPITCSGLNPARSTGIAIFAQSKHMAVSPISQLWLFWICPLLAASLVALVIIMTSIITDNMAMRAMGAATDAQRVAQVDADAQAQAQADAFAPGAQAQLGPDAQAEAFAPAGAQVQDQSAQASPAPVQTPVADTTDTVAPADTTAQTVDVSSLSDSDAEQDADAGKDAVAPANAGTIPDLQVEPLHTASETEDSDDQSEDKPTES
ncbi:aquaporin [Bifidobacterium sp. B4081]|uniref:MIP/aquaporin family protein n=1 Tax=unclassified Bifidobacterium TaxID=2608897 RepID=UPI00226A0A5F|nr:MULTISPECIES: aquaporin [unclassified Bifidobacterium]MCX8643707.1 aquaporin [Bifidobacterium sp. B4077]MCX8645889.1 aquaporin [Bifidobacterium sp. B4081]MCX8647548.1 aquaporin [Bifidobacterium sp. B4107]MCX8651728.1 aquaporin [Bifidobacterium sp. B4111]MCX8658159.1 aquaporin [Bifidobacterium sp. B4114]